MRVVTATLGFAFTIYLLALNELKVPHSLAALIIASYVLVPLVLVLLAGWWALPLVSTAFAVATVLYQLLVWNDDPQLAGIDDLPPIVAIVTVLPWLLLLVAFGAALRQRKLERPSRG